jgi:hypothetical protein
VFTIDDDGTEVQLIVLSPRDLRVPLKTSPEGRPLNRARLPVVETLLAES